MPNLKLQKISTKSQARAGILTTRRGKIKTPFFMPIGTVGAVKTLTYEDLEKLGAQIELSNTYHLMLRPGADYLKKVGGLHKFMNWQKPILTDSGGFQVFSLSKIRKVKDDGVEFQSHLDGKKYFLTPEESINVQLKIGSDIMMVLDECVGNPCEYSVAKTAMIRTTAWAKKCREFLNKKIVQAKNKTAQPLLFGIVQGSLYKDLRLQSAKELKELNFDGYAVGGLAVGEDAKAMYKVLDLVCPELPKDKPKYLMGVGKPEQIVEAVKRGIDMFDCVIPTREARHGRLYEFKNDNLNSKNFYQTCNLLNQKFSRDHKPINANSKFEILRKYSKAYLHHLFKIKEPLAIRLATLNNLEFYLDLMSKIRQDVERGEI
ncbi:MAG: tRNA guanosine(34) transglycosylase Tgt [Patescibacteria group bacterium]